MSFQISARTVLELGSELISSDGVALYELVKNAIDAGAKRGVEIRFVVTLGRTALVELQELLRRSVDMSVDETKARILGRLETSATGDCVEQFTTALRSYRTNAALLGALPDLYARWTYLEISDTGSGMTAADLRTKYLVIGTDSRRREVEAAVVRVSSGAKERTPYLGEKGIGRLSVMRLGEKLHLETATADDAVLNVLDIDWSAFSDSRLLVHDIKLAPTRGTKKESEGWSGTRITIRSLSSNWNQARVHDAMLHLARLTDPFDTSTKRYRVALYFNEERMPPAKPQTELLDHAHATLKAKYSFDRDGNPSFAVDMTFTPKEGRAERKSISLSVIDLEPLLSDDETDVPKSALRTVGAFDLDAYWYNRQRLRAIDGLGNLNDVRAEQKRWAGIMVFRDGYRVLPYGDEKDDWLGLDRKALGSPGYKLNKSQFLGRVQIGRLSNPQLLDQTNREGLKDTPEKTVLIELLKFAVQNLLRDFMDEVERRQRRVEINLEDVDEKIASIRTRVRTGLKQIRAAHGGSAPEVESLQGLFDEMVDYFEQAKELAGQAEGERTRLIQLAGVGLMLEVVAHELARGTQLALVTINDAQAEDISSSLGQGLRTLRAQMQTINKRLRTLDPLSVSGRQRRETFDLADTIRDSFGGREAQFARHGIKIRIQGEGVRVNGVKGMFTQIIENLLSNSVFWLKRSARESAVFKPRIDVRLDAAERAVFFSDNGPGIDPTLREEVFKPFFSTKDKKRRQGLGLYIARECAADNGSRLELSDETTAHKDRLNTFVLYLPEG